MKCYLASKHLDVVSAAMNNAINKIPLKILALTSTGFGIFVLGFGYYTKRQTALNFAREPYYQNSIRHLRRHHGAQFVLGLPILDKVIDYCLREWQDVPLNKPPSKSNHTLFRLF